MKILIASDLHWPTINGVATFSRNLARGMAEHGHEVLVIAPSQNGKKYKEVDVNHEIHRTAAVPFPFYQNFRISLNPGREVKHIIEEFDPDVIHIQMLLGIGQAAMKYGNKYGIPVVSTNHAMPENLMDNLRLLAPVSRPINYILTEYGKRFHSKSDVITMPTQSAIDMFKASDKVDVPMYAVSNGIDLSRFTPGEAPTQIYEKFGLSKDKTIISYLGRLDAEKHLSVLVESFRNLHAELPNLHLLLVGGGTDEEHLMRLIYEYDLAEDVTFTGRVTDEEMVALHKVGVVYVMPSPAELQSIATLEAMASGKPIVAVNAGALGELCQTGRNGYLCEKDNVEEMTEGIRQILVDDKKRATFAKESLTIAETHDIQTTYARFEEIYSDLIKA